MNNFLERPLVYVAAPYTNPDPVANTHEAVKVVDQLAVEGIVTPVCPHLSLLWHLVSPHNDIEFWYQYDLAILARCDAILRLPGASSGADAEVAFAVDRDLPVFTFISALNAWARTWAADRSS